MLTRGRPQRRYVAAPVVVVSHKCVWLTVGVVCVDCGPVSVPSSSRRRLCRSIVKGAVLDSDRLRPLTEFRFQFSLWLSQRERDRQTDRQTDRDRERVKERHRDRHRDRETQTDRQTERDSDRRTDRQTETLQLISEKAYSHTVSRKPVDCAVVSYCRQ